MRSRSDSATSRRRFLAASTAAVTGAWLSGGVGEVAGVDAMRTTDFKLVLRPDGVRELYDLQKEPRE